MSTDRGANAWFRDIIGARVGRNSPSAGAVASSVLAVTAGAATVDSVVAVGAVGAVVGCSTGVGASVAVAVEPQAARASKSNAAPNILIILECFANLI
jgi:hypothetical protein